MEPAYKVIKFIDQKTNQEFFAIAKVHFDENGKPDGCQEPILDADTLQELVEEFEQVKKAFETTQMHERDFFNVH
jgi:hypothetical protein